MLPRLYYALVTNDSAAQAMGDAKLQIIAAKLISQVKKSVTINWKLRKNNTDFHTLG